ncbi:MAG: hypothetical protein C4547_07000, partial [Phycisphaerales bacterium]
MHPYTRIKQRLVTIASSIPFLIGSGCKSPPRSPAGPAAALEVHAPDVPLPPQARVALADLEPRIERPAPPQAVRPLSQRGQRQLDLGADLERQQRFTEAAIELERGLRYDPNHPALLEALARLYWTSDNRRRAQSSAEAAVAADPDSALSYYVLGRVAAGEGRVDDVITSLRTAAACSSFEQDPALPALVYFHLARALAEREYLTAALDVYARFEQWAARVDAAAASTEFTTLTQLHGGIAAEPRAHLLERLGDYGLAAGEVQRIIDRLGSTDERQQWRARLLLKAGRNAEALAAARAIQTLTDETVDTLVEAYRRGPGQEELVLELQRRRQAAPDDPAIVAYLADALEQAGRADDARRALESFTRDHPRAAAVHQRLIQLHLAR